MDINPVRDQPLDIGVDNLVFPSTGSQSDIDYGLSLLAESRQRPYDPKTAAAPHAVGNSLEKEHLFASGIRESLDLAVDPTESDCHPVEKREPVVLGDWVRTCISEPEFINPCYSARLCRGRAV